MATVAMVTTMTTNFTSLTNLHIPAKYQSTHSHVWKYLNQKMVHLEVPCSLNSRGRGNFLLEIPYYIKRRLGSDNSHCIFVSYIERVFENNRELVYRSESDIRKTNTVKALLSKWKFWMSMLFWTILERKYTRFLHNLISALIVCTLLCQKPHSTSKVSSYFFTSCTLISYLKIKV